MLLLLSAQFRAVWLRKSGGDHLRRHTAGRIVSKAAVGTVDNGWRDYAQPLELYLIERPPNKQ